MEKVKLLGVPKEIRSRFNEECRNALLDTRDDEEKSLSPHRAAMLLKHRILGGVQVRLSFQVTPDPLTDKAIFNEDDLFILHDAAWNHLVGWQVQDKAQQMKLRLDAPVEEGEDALETLRDTCYAEIISYKDEDDGGTVFKFVGDASLEDLTLAAEQYAAKTHRAGKREIRAKAIVHKMRVRGAVGSTTVSEALEYPSLKAV